MVLHLNKESFDKVISENAKVLVDFWAPWCGPCRMLGPVMEELAGEVTDAVVAKVNVDEEPELAARFNVESIPTVLVFANGKLANKSVGYAPKAHFVNLLK